MVNNHFTFVVPTRNSSATLEQAMASVAYQSYKNWDMIVVDDASTDNTVDKLTEVCAKFNIDTDEKVKILQNNERLWEVRNILEALKYVKPDSIVCRLDLDDYLCDLNALEIINRAYNENELIDAAWCSQRWFGPNGITPNNISGPMPNGVDVYKFPWVSSHLKTFRKRLIEGVRDENFRGQDGEYFKRIGDQAIYLPVLHNAKRYAHLPFVAYAYYCDMSPATFQSDDAKFQKSEAEYLRHRGYIK